MSGSLGLLVQSLGLTLLGLEFKFKVQSLEFAV